MSSAGQSHSQQKPSAPDYNDIYNDEMPPPYHEALKYSVPPLIGPSPSVNVQAQSPACQGSTPATTTTQRQVTAGIDPDLCPICGGSLYTDFPSLCLVLACLWFPFGVLFCLMSARKRCINCKMVFDK